MIKFEIKDRIKEIRVLKHLNQSELGKILSVSQDTISLWENGYSLPNTEHIVLICKKFNVSADYILCLVD